MFMEKEGVVVVEWEEGESYSVVKNSAQPEVVGEQSVRAEGCQASTQGGDC